MKYLQLDENISLLIGQNAQDNWNLLSKSNSKNIFLHISSFSSAYGIIDFKNSSLLLNKRIINIAANHIKDTSSKTKNLNRVSIDYTPVSNVCKGTNIGEVYYKNRKLVNTVIV